MKRKGSPGFTLVELLVVIAIIGILVALLLPAVQAAREAARRMQCGNNLHQIGIGLHNYHDTYKAFPPGWVVPANDGAPANAASHECWGWSALMLPFVEQAPLHEKIGITRMNLWRHLQLNGPATKVLIETNLSWFMCPSDTGFNKPGKVHNNRHFNDGVGAAGALTPLWPGVSNYMGNAGHRSVALRNANTGIFYGDVGIRMADITDGTSNTVACGERATKDCFSGTWVGVRNPNGAGTRGVWVVSAHSQPKINQDVNVIAWNVANVGCGEGFTSMHPGGIQILLCDGSARFVSETINHRWSNPSANVNGTVADSKNQLNGTFQRMMTRDDDLTFTND